MGYDIRYEGTTSLLAHKDGYDDALREAKSQALRAGRDVVIGYFGGVYVIVHPDGSVSTP